MYTMFSKEFIVHFISNSKLVSDQLKFRTQINLDFEVRQD